ncbi:MAG: hypothetical protein GOP50_02085 [Candidatus Heimdallarchaeota archaeon]|nr:hypothetical protein [Candidatus Heimdallarchaeota archaeon]
MRYGHYACGGLTAEDNPDGVQIFYNDTWAYDTNSDTWTNMNPVTKPQRIGHQMAYEEESDLVILFGGLVASNLDTFYNDIFTYDLTQIIGH